MTKNKLDPESKIHLISRIDNLPKGVKEHAYDELQKILKYASMDDIVDIHVYFDKVHDSENVDIHMRFHRLKIKAGGKSNTWHDSINIAYARLIRRFQHFKGKLRDHHNRPLHSVDLNVDVIRSPISEEDEINEDIATLTTDELISNYKHDVVSQKKIPLKSLTEEEAVMKMELTQKNFLIYRSEEENIIKVIYVRKDGEFGIISVQE